MLQLPIRSCSRYLAGCQWQKATCMQLSCEKSASASTVFESRNRDCEPLLDRPLGQTRRRKGWKDEWRVQDRGARDEMQGRWPGDSEACRNERPGQRETKPEQEQSLERDESATAAAGHPRASELASTSVSHRCSPLVPAECPEQKLVCSEQPVPEPDVGSSSRSLHLTPELQRDCTVAMIRFRETAGGLAHVSAAHTSHPFRTSPLPSTTLKTSR